MFSWIKRLFKGAPGPGEDPGAQVARRTELDRWRKENGAGPDMEPRFRGEDRNRVDVSLDLDLHSSALQAAGACGLNMSDFVRATLKLAAPSAMTNPDAYRVAAGYEPRNRNLSRG